MAEYYLIWSNEHRGWWKPNRRGYGPGINDAGKYSRSEALRICQDALPTAASLGMISEIPVRVSDLRESINGAAGPALHAIFNGGTGN